MHIASYLHNAPCWKEKIISRTPSKKTWLPSAQTEVSLKERSYGLVISDDNKSSELLDGNNMRYMNECHWIPLKHFHTTAKFGCIINPLIPTEMSLVSYDCEWISRNKNICLTLVVPCMAEQWIKVWFCNCFSSISKFCHCRPRLTTVERPIIRQAQWRKDTFWRILGRVGFLFLILGDSLKFFIKNLGFEVPQQTGPWLALAQAQSILACIRYSKFLKKAAVQTPTWEHTHVLKI